jgi:hypothetical protein
MTWRMRQMSFRAKLTVWWTLGFGLLLAVATGHLRRFPLVSGERPRSRRHGRRSNASSTDGLDIHLHGASGSASKAPTPRSSCRFWRPTDEA